MSIQEQRQRALVALKTLYEYAVHPTPGDTAGLPSVADAYRDIRAALNAPPEHTLTETERETQRFTTWWLGYAGTEPEFLCQALVHYQRQKEAAWAAWMARATLRTEENP